jgi:hypothetical protein
MISTLMQVHSDFLGLFNDIFGRSPIFPNISIFVDTFRLALFRKLSNPSQDANATTRKSQQTVNLKVLISTVVIV